MELFADLSKDNILASRGFDSIRSVSSNDAAMFASSRNSQDTAVHQDQGMQTWQYSGAGPNGVASDIDIEHPSGNKLPINRFSQLPVTKIVKDPSSKDMAQSNVFRSAYEALSRFSIEMDSLQRSGSLPVLHGKTEPTKQTLCLFAADEQVPNHDGYLNVQELWLQMKRSLASHSQNLADDWPDVKRTDSLYDVAQFYDEQLSTCLRGTCGYMRMDVSSPRLPGLELKGK